MIGTTAGTAAPAAPSAAPLALLRRWLMPALLVAEIVVFAALSPRFLASDNLANIAFNAADLALVAAGVTLVVLLGGIDVSTGFAVGVVAWIVARLVGAGLPAPLIVLAAICCGGLLGAVNGLLVTAWKVPPIIATLGTAAIFQTLLFALWNSTDVFSDAVTTALSGTRVLGVPVVLGVVAVVYVLLHLLLTRRRFGRDVYAIGANREAARLAGINTARVTFACFVLVGGLVGLAACVYVGRVGVVQASSGNELTLLAIASVVVGGTSILGGEGGIGRTLGGLAFIVILQNGVVLAGVPPLWNDLLVGAAILLAVGVDVLPARAGRRASLRRLVS